MTSEKRNVLLFLFVVILLTIPVAAGAEPDQPQTADAPVTIITVNSTADPDNSKSKTCLSDAPCTLRRAINQSRNLTPAQRPAEIRFNIANSDSGYDGTLKVWRIKPMTGSDPAVFRRLIGGLVTIDGSSQPGGRTNGPKVIVVGPGTGSKDCLIVGNDATGAHDGNVVKGMAFQNFKTHMHVNSNNNQIVNNWFGLTADGRGPYLRNDDPQDGSGSGGISLSAGVTKNSIEGNVFLGFDGTAADFNGEDNTFYQNYVGTNADGLVPGKQADPDLVCTKVDWLGGGGISLEGESHEVRENLFAGLRQEVFSASTQPDAVRVTGKGHWINLNRIGVDKNGKTVGVCGRGIFMADSPKESRVSLNVIVNSGLSAISLNGPLYDENELRGNVIRQSVQWTEVEGNPQPEDAIQLGPRLPDSLQEFNPARVTKINGKQVSGSSGAFSPCPNCTVELFLDDQDVIVEALQLVTVVKADGSGSWQATLPRELKQNEGLRTTSTSAQFNTIPGLSADTTTGLSGLYTAQRPPYFLPMIVGQ